MPGVNRPIVVLEPNKRGSEHASFNAAMLEAVRLCAARRDARVILICERDHRREIVCISKGLERLEWRDIPVMSGQLRRFLAKYVLEMAAVFKAIAYARRVQGELVILSLMSNALATIVALRPFLRPIRLHIVLHREIEAMAIQDKQKIYREGWWARLALVKLFDGTWPYLYLLGSGVRERFLQKFEYPKLRSLRVVEHPFIFKATRESRLIHGRTKRLGFVGWGTIAKGILEFFELANRLAAHVSSEAIEFVVVGGIESAARQYESPYVTVLAREPGGLRAADFERAVGELDCALFLYRQTYEFTASGAVFDVINQGVELFSTPNGYLADLASLDPGDGLQLFADLCSLQAEIQSRIETGRGFRRCDYNGIKRKHGIENVSEILANALG